MVKAKAFLSGLFAGLVLSLVVAGSAQAHGDAAHKKAAGPVKKEQKPWGIAGDAKAVTRTIKVGMNDKMRFVPERIDVKLGETIRFAMSNDGKLMHEFCLEPRRSSTSTRRS